LKKVVANSLVFRRRMADLVCEASPTTAGSLSSRQPSLRTNSSRHFSPTNARSTPRGPALLAVSAFLRVSDLRFNAPRGTHFRTQTSNSRRSETRQRLNQEGRDPVWIAAVRTARVETKRLSACPGFWLAHLLKPRAGAFLGRDSGSTWTMTAQRTTRRRDWHGISASCHCRLRR
jgi:hypothetical protein